jgi:hypothetical protein
MSSGRDKRRRRQRGRLRHLLAYYWRQCPIAMLFTLATIRAGR